MKSQRELVLASIKSGHGKDNASGHAHGRGAQK
jgi:hypothetical protein